MKRSWKFLGALLCVLAGAPWVAHAQLIISDTLTGASSSYDWKALNGACLTAGNDTGRVGPGPGSAAARAAVVRAGDADGAGDGARTDRQDACAALR